MTEVAKQFQERQLGPSVEEYGGKGFRVYLRKAGRTAKCLHENAATMVKNALPALAIALLGILGPALAGGPAEAAAPQASAVTLYQGQGVDANLLTLLPDLFSGELRFEKTYFTAVGYYRPLETPRMLQSVFDFLHVPETDTGLELIAARHYGLQHNGEVDAAYLLRFSGLQLSSVIVRFGMGFGLSYALGRPSYEDGSVENPGKRYRFQYYGAYELEWGLASAPRISLVTRIHHRSGIYGVIAPPRVGSNFLTLGLRYSY